MDPVRLATCLDRSAVASGAIARSYHGLSIAVEGKRPITIEPSIVATVNAGAIEGKRRPLVGLRSRGLPPLDRARRPWPGAPGVGPGATVTAVVDHRDVLAGIAVLLGGYATERGP